MIKIEPTWWDRVLLSVAPKYALERLRARATVDSLARHFEAAQPGRRTDGWHRDTLDADFVLRAAARELRNHARDLIRNNGYAKRGVATIANGAAGWGIQPSPVDADTAVVEKAAALWKRWAETTECESDNRATFAGIQRLAMRSLVSDGEVFLRRRPRRAVDDLTIPLQLQVLEADYLNTAWNALDSQAGGPIIQGVEFDKLGRRAAYWMWSAHPGSGRNMQAPKRIDASEIIHLYDVERPGQSRGVSWLGASIVNLRDLDEYEDAELMKQKISACFAAFVTDTDGVGSYLGGTDDEGDEGVEKFEPGMIHHLPPGRAVSIANPPGLTSDALPVRTLRKVAAGLGITYEDLTGDYSQVNFSSARMGRLAYQGNVQHWQYNLLIPLLCTPVWNWAMESAVAAGELPYVPSVEWTPPALPLLEPDKEGLAYQRLVRTGAMTLSQMIREQGREPAHHLAEYARDLKALDAAGIVLDSDPRRVTAAGQAQPPEEPTTPAPADPAA
jgi:lambda family phage portal protein